MSESNFSHDIEVATIIEQFVCHKIIGKIQDSSYRYIDSVEEQLSGEDICLQAHGVDYHIDVKSFSYKYLRDHNMDMQNFRTFVLECCGKGNTKISFGAGLFVTIW